MIHVPLERHQSGLAHVSEGLMKHGIGLKKKPRYRVGFLAKTSVRSFGMYDMAGIKYANGSAETPFFDILKVKTNPAKGYIAIAYRETGNGNVVIKVIDVLSQRTLASIIEARSSYGFDFDVLENGDIYTLNGNDGRLKRYDMNGNLKSSLPGAVTQGRTTVYLLTCPQRNIFYTAAINENTFKLINIKTLSLITTLSKGSTIVLTGVTKDGVLIGNTSSQVVCIKINYTTNTIKDTVYSKQFTYELIFSGVYKDEIYIMNYLSAYDPNSTLLTLSVNDLSIISQRVFPSRVLSVDDKHIFTSDLNSPYLARVFKKTDATEVLSVNTGVPAWYIENIMSNKGNYAVFNKYW